MTAARHLLIDRADLTTTRIENVTLPDLADGEALVRIDRVAMTANNVTYAAIAHLIPYFEFFPSPVEGFGRLPTWGFGEVVATTNDELAVNDRLFGFWPASTHLVMKPERQGRGTVIDQMPHRQPLPAAYNAYTLTEFDPTYRTDLEDVMCVFRPLFMTAFSIDDLFGAKSFMGAQRIVISSASSKTALATAHMLGMRDGLDVVGLTGTPNVIFVAGLATYDRVVAYENVGEVDQGVPTAYIDYSGSTHVRRSVREALGSDLIFDLGVGIADWSSLGGRDEFDNPPVTPYFAPSTIRDRMQELGRDAYMKMYGEAWESFLPLAMGSLRFEEHPGIEAMEEAYAATVAGDVKPNRGLIIRPGGPDRMMLSPPMP